MSNPNGRFGSITGIEQSRPKCPLYGQLRTFVAPIETGFLSVRVLADQVGEFVQVGDHGIGLDRRVPEGEQRGPGQHHADRAIRRRLLRRLGRRLAPGAVLLLSATVTRLG